MALDRRLNWESQVAHCDIFWHIAPVKDEHHGVRWLQLTILLHLSAVGGYHSLISQLHNDAIVILGVEPRMANTGRSFFALEAAGNLAFGIGEHCHLPRSEVGSEVSIMSWRFYFKVKEIMEQLKAAKHPKSVWKPY